VELADTKGEKISLDPSGKVHFEGESSGKHYKLELELLNEIDVEVCTSISTHTVLNEVLSESTTEKQMDSTTKKCAIPHREEGIRTLLGPSFKTIRKALVLES
jgi:hypothetical protein